MTLPTSVKVIDVTYSIEYVNKPSDVDINGRESLWGQCDYWTHSIRIYNPKNFSHAEVMNSVWHEVLHALCNRLKIKTVDGKLTNNEDAIHLLATGINSICNDNAWLRKNLDRT